MSKIFLGKLNKFSENFSISASSTNSSVFSCVCPTSDSVVKYELFTVVECTSVNS